MARDSEFDLHDSLARVGQRALKIKALADKMQCLLDEIEGTLDEQTYDEFRKADFDLPDDAELNVNLRAGLIRRISKMLSEAKAVLGPVQEAANV